MHSPLGPLALLAVSGLFQAAFALPVRHLRKWRWEHMWVAQSVTANLLFPLAWAAVVPAAFWTRASAIPPSHWLACYAWGLAWGAGGVAWGLAMTRLGIAFANSFVFGITVLTGAVLPLAIGAVDRPAHPLLFAAGLVLSLSSTALLGFFRRSGSQEPLLVMPLPLRSYPRIVVLAIFAGLASAAYGLAFTLSFGFIRGLVSNGIAPLNASLIVVLPAYFGSASVAIPLGLFVAIRSRTLRLFASGSAARNWILALIMGLFAAAAAILYGFAGSGRGHPSPNVSFGIFISFLVLGGVAFGLAGGEMRGGSLRDRAGLWLSACGLVAGAWLLNAR